MNKIIINIALIALLSYSNVVFSFSKEQYLSDLEKISRFVEEGKLNDAIIYWSELKSKYSGSEGHYEYELGKLYFLNGDYDKSIKIYEDGLNLKNAYPMLYVGIVLSYFEIGSSIEAEKWSDILVSKQPNWWRSYYIKSNLEWRKGNYSIAKVLARKSIELEARSESLFLVAILSWELKEYQDVVNAMEVAINIDNSYAANIDGMVLSALSLAELNRKEDAINALLVLKNMNPNFTDENYNKVLEEINAK